MSDGDNGKAVRFRLSADARSLERACIGVFQAADRGSHTTPAPDREDHRVLDSMLAALGWLYMDLRRATVELESIVQLQQPDGRIPTSPEASGATLPLLGSILRMLYHSAKRRERRLEGRLAALVPVVDHFHRFLQGRDQRWLVVSTADDERLWGSSLVLGGGTGELQDIVVNSLLVQAETDLADVAIHVGFPNRAIVARRIKRAMAIANQMWWQDEGIFSSLAEETGWVKVSPAGLSPMWSGSALAWQGKEMARRHLHPEEGFWGRFPLATSPLADPDHAPDTIWQGATSPLMNWLAIRGTYRYGFDSIAKTLEETTLQQISSQGLWEAFDSNTGEGIGERRSVATAALALSMLKTPYDDPR